jgi:tetratricopeptide (TPR) repeat protein
MRITSLIPDGYNGQIKRLTCSICKRQFYITLADYLELSPVSYCHECSVILLTELNNVQHTIAHEDPLPPPSKVKPIPPPRVPQPRTIDREKMSAVQLINEGNAYLKAWQYKKALASFDQALEKGAASAVSHCGRGGALYKLERYKEALASYDDALRLDPTYAAAYDGKGVVLRHFKRLDETLATYDQALQFNSSLFHACLGKY